MAEDRVGIRLYIEGEEELDAVIKKLQVLAKTAEGRNEIALDVSDAEKKVISLTNAINRLKREMASQDGDELDASRKVLKGYQADLRDANLSKRILAKGTQESKKALKEEADAAKKAAQEAKELAKAEQQAAREAERLAAQAPKMKTFGEVFNTWSSRVAHLGSAFQSAGNALTQLTSPFRQLTNGIAMGAGYKMLNKFTEGLSSGFARSDTMRKYVRLMKEYETANYNAEQSRKELDESVQGLPIALDDAVSLAQRYTLSLGDMERGTKLAIATNNAFLASMATENQRYQGMLQMQDLLNGKKLNSREWMSLGASMGKAINEVGKEFGYTNENMGEFRQLLYGGKIDTQEFLDALQKVGTGNGSLVKLAQQSMDTWEAFFSRIGTASSRLMYGILTSLDEVVSTMSNGKFKSLNSLLDDRIIPSIDRMTESAKAWIKAHPQELTDFFRQLSSINWSSLLTGFAQGVKAQASILTFFAKLADNIGGGSLAWIGRWGIYLNMIGKGLTIFGGLLKGSRHIFGGLIALLTTKIGKRGLFGGLLEKIFGKGVPTKELAEAPKAIESFRGIIQSLSGLLKVAGGIGIATLTGWGVTKAVKSIIHDLKDIGREMEGVNWESAGIAMGGFATFCGAFGLVGKALNKAKVGWGSLKGVAIAGAFTTFIAFVASADFQLLATGAKAFNSMTANIKSAFDNLDQIGEIPDKASNVKDFAQGLVEIYSAFGGNKKDEGFNAIKPKKVDNFNKIASGMNSTIENLAKIGTSLKGLTKKGLPTEEEITSVSDSLKPVLEALGNMVYNAPKVLKNNESGNLAQYMSDSFKGLNDAIGILLGKKGLIARLPELAKGIGRLQGLKVLETLGEDGGQFDQLGAALKKMANSLTLGGFNTDQLNLDIGNILSAVGNVQAILKKLKALGKEKIDAKGTGNIQKVIENIKKAFDTAKATELSGQIMIFVTAVKAAIQTIKDLNEEIEIDITFKLSQGFYDSKKKVIKEIKDAKKDIKSQNGGISFSIGVRVFFRVATNFASAMARITRERQALWRQTGNGNGWITGHVSTGGQISRNGVLYRSGGGSIFKPRGTDKIPAMLTQGEYVHKKQAVDYFGVDFMRKVNNMDVRGAMQSLLTKAGNNNSFNRQSIINNTVNNNQRVTQNISTNNPNFTRVQMGRFAGAL